MVGVAFALERGEVQTALGRLFWMCLCFALAVVLFGFSSRV